MKPVIDYFCWLFWGTRDLVCDYPYLTLFSLFTTLSVAVAAPDTAIVIIFVAFGTLLVFSCLFVTGVFNPFLERLGRLITRG